MVETLGQYKILDLIGIGRMGELYRARDTRAGRTVALRVVADEIAADPARRARYLEDAAAAARLSHPNIAAVYQVIDEHGDLSMISEYVPGDTLQTVIAGRALNLRHALDHGIQLAEVLAEAHAEGVVHRDIRPDNIIITPKGNAKFLDFGLAAWTASGTARNEAPAALAADAAEPVSVVVDASRRSRGAGFWIVLAIIAAAILAALLMTTAPGQRWWSAWRQTFGLILRSP